MAWEIKADPATKMTYMPKIDRKKIMKDILNRDQAGDFMGSNKEHSVDDLHFPDLDYAPDKANSDYAREDMTDTEPSSSFVISNDLSHLSNNVDRWMINSAENNVPDGGVSGRVPTVQRSTLAARSSFSMARACCVLALALPLFSFNTPGGWRCSPSQVLSSAELFLSNIATVVGRARANVSRIAQEQMTRDCFAMAMDIVLVVYAFGFLLLSLYQASVIG